MEDGYSSEQWDIIKTPAGEAYDRALHSLKKIAENLLLAITSGGGSLGREHGMPVLKHERNVRWFKLVGTGDADATSAANAATGAYNDAATYGTADQDDMFIYLEGAYDFLGSVNGWEGTIAGMGVYGVGWQTSFVNSNVGALYVMRITTNNIELGAFGIPETTATVDGISILNSGSTYIHGVFFSTAMENGISYLNPSNQLLAWDCWFSNITNDGIECTGSGAVIWNCRFDNVGDNAIHLNGNLADGCVVFENKIAGSGVTDIGINVVLADNCSINDNFIADCTTGLKVDTGTANSWEGNHGTHESNWTTALAGGVQDVFGTAAAHRYPLNTTGVVRIYLDYVNMAAADQVTITIMRKNDGTNSRQVTQIVLAGVQTDLCPVYEYRYTETRTIYIHVRRVAGAIAAFPIGIEEADN